MLITAESRRRLQYSEINENILDEHSKNKMNVFTDAFKKNVFYYQEKSKSFRTESKSPGRS